MRYLVLGASAAGIHAVSTLRTLDQTAEIILVSEDKDIYSRCILHHYMEGIRDMERLSFVPKDFIERNKIQWIKGVKAISLNPQEKSVGLSNDQLVGYDKLLIATGAHSFIPPIPGINDAENVYGFRNISDCKQIMEKAKDPEINHIVVIGAGLVGIDVTSGLLDYQKSIYIIDMEDRMLPMQLDQKAARAYQDAYEKKGVKQLYQTGVKAIQKSGRSKCGDLILSDGSVLPCDLLIVTAGVRANVEFLINSGVETDKFGLLIDDSGRTNIEDIYGAGDVTGQSPIWPAAVKEGIIAASNMAGQHRQMNDFFASKSTMNFLGIPTLSLGIHDAPDESYIVETLSDDRGNYKKIIYKDGLIVGAILQGDLSYAGVLTQLIRRKINIAKVKKPIFKIDYSDFFHVQKNFEFNYQEEV